MHRITRPVSNHTTLTLDFKITVINSLDISEVFDSP